VVDSGVSSSVRKNPGSTIIVPIPNGCTSPARDSIQPSRANFDAAYAEPEGLPIRPAPEEIEITRPDCCLRITGSTARLTVIGPKRLVSICERTCSVVSSSKKPARKLPALLTSTSKRPKRSTAADTASSALWGSVTSRAVTSRLSCAPTAEATVSGLRPVATTL
jgi:hypothetical protein